MNRLRLWGYVILLVAVGLGNLYFVSSWVTARSLAQLDGDLRGAAALLDARVRLLAADAGALADTVARAPGVAQAGEGTDASAAADAVLRPAAEALKVDPATAFVGVARPGAAQARAGGQPVALPEGPLVADPQRGVRRDGWVRSGERVWMAAGVPAGRGAAVVAGLPLDASLLATLRAPRGVEATLVVDGKVAASSGQPDAARAMAPAASQAPRRTVDVGRLGAVQGYLPLPAMPLLFASAPEARAHAVPLEGAPGAVVVLSAATAPHLAGLATYQGAALVVLLLLAAIGVVLGLLAREEGGRAVPRELLQVADRIRQGDFSARAPVLAGSAGVLASALNRAAEAAEGAPRPAGETGTQPLFTPAPARPAEPAPSSLAEAPRGEAAEPPQAWQAEPQQAWQAEPPVAREPAGAEPAPARAMDETPSEAPAPAALGGGAVEPVPAATRAEADAPAVAQPEQGGWSAEAGGASAVAAAEPFAPPIPPVPEPPPGVIPELPPPPPPEVGGAAPEVRDALPEPTATAASAAAPFAPPQQDAVPLPGASAAEEESHWRAVFDDFVRTRGETGEGGGAVSYDRFRSRLQKNRDQLVEKYGCRTVRFQVYVKEGKAAVRATPVR